MKERLPILREPRSGLGARALQGVRGTIQGFWHDIRYGFFGGDEQPYDPHIRGTRIVSYDEARKILSGALPRHASALSWGLCPIPSSKTLRMRIVGSEGSGKTTYINLLLKYSLLQRIVPGGKWRLYIYDHKNSYIQQLHDLGLADGVRTYHIHPFTASGLAWDMAKDITDFQEAESIAKILFPRAEQSSGNSRFFEESEQLVLQAVINSFLHRHPGRWSLRDVLLAFANTQDLKEIIGWCPESIPNGSVLESLFPQDNLQLAASIQAGLVRKVNEYITVAARWHYAVQTGGDKRRFSLGEWLANPGVMVFGYHHVCEEAIRSLHRLLFKRLSQMLLDEGAVFDQAADARRTWIIFDELAGPGRIDGLEALFEQGRDRGVCIVLGFQQLSHLQQIYGKEGAQSLIARCHYQGALNLTCHETARWVQDHFGHEEREQPQQSYGTSDQGNTSSTTITQVEKPTVFASDLLNLPLPNGHLDRGPAGYFSIPGPDGQLIYELRVPMALIRSLLPEPVQGELPREPLPDQEFRKLTRWSDEERMSLGLLSRSKPIDEGEPRNYFR